MKNSAGGTAIRIMVMQTMKSNVRVKLLAFTPLPESVVAAAARLCYSASSAEDLIVMLHDDKEQRDKFIKTSQGQVIFLLLNTFRLPLPLMVSAGHVRISWCGIVLQAIASKAKDMSP